MTAAGHEPNPDGQRLVLLWVCWIVLALFLLAAGVVALGR